MTENKVVSFEVSLEQHVLQKVAELVPGNAGLSSKASKIASDLIRDLAAGGMMLPPEAASRIRKALQTLDGGIVEVVEHAAGRKGDHLSFEVVVDPIWEIRLREIAQFRGVPYEVVVDDCVKSIMAAGWIWENLVPADPPPISFTREEYEEIRRIVADGKQMVGQDIVKWIREAARSKEEGPQGQPRAREGKNAGIRVSV